MAPQCCLPWLRPQAPEASGDDRSLLTGPGAVHAGKLATGLVPFSPSLPRVNTGLSSVEPPLSMEPPLARMAPAPAPSFF